jgi:tripartite ATP-independent transporter DctP family solute receptor
MNTMKKLLMLVMIGLVLVPIVFANGTQEKATDSAKPIVLRIGHGNSADYPVSEALAVFADKVEAYSNGSIDVQVFNDGALGQERDCIEGVNLGTMEMARVNCGNMASFVSELNAFSIPFIFRSQEHYWNVLNGEVGDFFVKRFQEKGYKLLCWYDEGARNIYNKEKFIETPEDLKGLKIRTMGAQSIQDGFKALGASPTPMNFGEVYTSLQQGVIDAAENNYASIFTSKQYEVAPYLTDTAHLRIPGVLIMNLKLYKSFTTEQQEIIQKAANESRDWEIERFTTKEEDFKKQIIEDGAKFKALTEDQHAEMAELCAPVFDKYDKIIGQDIVKMIIKTK